MYFYIHVISYYIGNDRSINIDMAIDKLRTTQLHTEQKPTDRNLFIVQALYDELTPEIEAFFAKYNKTYDNLDVQVLFRYNTGGTTQTMFHIYNYLIDNNINSNFIGVYEDDAIFKNENFLNIVENYLNQDYILTGPLFTQENRTGTKQFEEPFTSRVNKSVVPFCRRYHIYNNDSSDELIDERLYKWVDGCGYITTIQNLSKIKNKMEKFSLAPETEKYTHCSHGINYGEVGFCTRLHVNGFKFIGLPASVHYQQLEQNTVGNKSI